MAAVQIIECDYYEYFVSNAGSVISSKSPSRAGDTSLIMNTIFAHYPEKSRRDVWNKWKHF